MKRTSGFYVVVSSMNDLCRWLRNDRIEIVEMRPVNGEDQIIIEYGYKQEEES